MIKGIDENMNKIENEILKANLCFEALTNSQKDEWLYAKNDIYFKAGETIVKQGFIASNIMILEEGLAKLDITIDGKTTTIGLITPNSFIGIGCTSASQNFNFSAIAIEKTKISTFDIRLFEKFIRQNGEFAFRMIKHMSIKTNSLVRNISRFSHKNIEGSLSILLLEFSDIYNSDTFLLPVKRNEIGKMLGYSKESVINTLSRFNKDEILLVQDKKITITDKDKLINIAKNG
ncbi:MAG: Crp/Fnr family transcriptional regulator [Bacteroidales bacterium]|nr:Crp/Fnr family transcriptional regulator [Bacteroidales bacterium]MDD4216989.1 Crp/Fnr family transcriptional regulator [Bacteroidales bacterium]MDY0142337.1 Crp/Fnr family transcriptional regulator [Bacteroidales bacterium]